MDDQKKKYDEWHNDPSKWKLGLFYFNKEDKRLLPPKRIKYLEWTINFANPLSVLVFVLMLIAIAVIFKIING